MKAMHSLFITATLASLFGCATEPASSDPGDSVATGSSQEAVTLVDCQKQVSACTLAAKSLSDLGHCTAQFEGCTTQAAADLVGHGSLLDNCRAAANKCLDGALTTLDIANCRNVFDSCAADAQSAANTAIGDAIAAAKSTVGKVTQTAIDTINAATGATTGALDAVNECVKDSNACLSGATLLTDVTQCEKAAESCINRAVTLVNNVTDPLPGPNPGQIANALSQCQTGVTSCLDQAVSATGVAACQGALQLCVKNATGIVDQTVNDLNGLIPAPFGLPSPTKPIDCVSAAAQCLLKMSSPLDCATQALACVTK